MVRLKATELDVYVDGKKVGAVLDCGDHDESGRACPRRKAKLHLQKKKRGP